MNKYIYILSKIFTNRTNPLYSLSNFSTVISNILCVLFISITLSISNGFKNNVILMGTTNILLLLEQIHSFKKYSHSVESVKKILSGVDSVIKHLTNTHKYIETLGSSIATTKDNYNKLIGNVEKSVFPSFQKLHKERHNKEYSGKIPNIEEGDIRKIDSNKLLETKKLIDSKSNQN